jgi:cell division inhibitor SepF
MYNNAAMEEEDEPRGQGGGFGGRFSRWFKNLTGNGVEDDEEDEYAVEEAEAVATGGARSYAAPAAQAAAGGGYATTSATGGGYNARMSGGSQGTPRRDTFRIAHAREGSITVMPVSSFADIQKAADRLKSGEPQIVNLEKTPPEVAERLIDFLNGVTYALDGFVEKVADGAYLFTPSHIAIQTDGPEPPAPKPFFDRG